MPKPKPKSNATRARSASKADSTRERKPSDTALRAADWKRLDATFLSLEGPASDWYRGLSEAKRRALVVAKLEQLIDAKVAPAVARGEASERRSDDLQRRSFMASWRLAEARLEVIRAEREAMLLDAQALANSAAGDDDAQRLHQALVDLHDLDALEREYERAMTRATEAHAALERLLARGDASDRWALAKQLAAALRTPEIIAEELPRLARALGVARKTLSEAMHEAGGTLAADGPVLAAYEIVSRVTGVSVSTVKRGEPRTRLAKRLVMARHADTKK